MVQNHLSKQNQKTTQLKLVQSGFTYIPQTTTLKFQKEATTSPTKQQGQTQLKEHHTKDNPHIERMTETK